MAENTNKQFSWSYFAIKMTSRKLWVAIAGLATSIMAFMQCDSNTIVQVTAIIGAIGSVLGYLIANGLTDDDTNTEAKSNKTSESVTAENL